MSRKRIFHIQYVQSYSIGSVMLFLLFVCRGWYFFCLFAISVILQNEATLLHFSTCMYIFFEHSEIMKW